MSTSTSTPDSASLFDYTSTSSLSTPLSELSAIAPTKVDGALLSCLLSGIDLEEVLETLKSIAQIAGETMLLANPSVSTSSAKRNTSDQVTETDKAIEAMVRDRLATQYPNLCFYGEESYSPDTPLTDAPTFVCDPIDGTLNFIHGFPNTAVCLALTIAKKPVVGVVYNPMRRDLFTAIRGRGAHLQTYDGSIHRLPLKAASPLQSLNSCLMAAEWGSQRSGPNWSLRSNMVTKLLTSREEGGAMVHSIRSSGSAALDFCYVAAGYIDLFWEGGCWAWDVAAGWVILEEAGGLVASANPDDWHPELEGRCYLGVRGAESGKEEVVEEVWRLMEGKRFNFG